MTVCEPGDIILVRFPFTDLSASKRRPALVLSEPEYHSEYGDAVVLALTSRAQADDSAAIRRWREAGLPKPTWIKPLIATLAAGMFVMPIGRLHRDDWPSVTTTIDRLIAPQFAA